MPQAEPPGSVDVFQAYQAAAPWQLGENRWWNELRDRTLAGGVTVGEIASAKKLVGQLTENLKRADALIAADPRAGTGQVMQWDRHLDHAEDLLQALEAGPPAR